MDDPIAFRYGQKPLVLTFCINSFGGGTEIEFVTGYRLARQHVDALTKKADLLAENEIYMVDFLMLS